MIKAVLFDMDGVIADTELSRLELLKEILKQRGKAHSVLDELIPKDIAGLNTPEFLKSILGDKLGDDEIDEIKQKRYEEFHKNPDKYIKPIEGIEELVKALHNKGVILVGLATSSRKKEAELILKTVEIDNYFNDMVCGDEVKNRKPDPEAYLKLLEKICVKKNEAIIIEDSNKGIIAAKNAGIRCIAITTTHDREEISHADYVVDSHDEILPIIQNL